MLLGSYKISGCLAVLSGLAPAQPFTQLFLKQMQRLPVQHGYKKVTFSQNT